MKQHLIITLLVSLCVSLTWISERGPDVAPIDSPDNQFSALRAQSHVERFSAEPHAMGSLANQRVGNTIADTLKQLGVETEIWRTERQPRLASDGRLIIGAHIENIIGRVYASQPRTNTNSDVILLMAHYDSVSMSPGASDNAMGVAAIVEAVRAQLASGTLNYDLVILLTDGEEEGLLGARAFFEQHPWADEIDLALNFDSRGNRGPVRLIQTSQNNSALIKAYSAAVKHPNGNGFMDMFGALSPYITDLGIALDHNIPALNFSALDGIFYYHSAIDTPDNLSLSTLQNMGNQALALLNNFNLNGLPIATDSQLTYFDVFSQTMFYYPNVWGWAPIIVCIIGLILTIRRTRASQIATGHGIALAAIVQLVWLLLTALLAFGIGYLLGITNDLQDPFELRRYFIISSGIGFSVSLIIVGMLSIPMVWRNNKLWCYWLAGMNLALLMAIALQCSFPQASHFFSWPTLVMVLAAYVHAYRTKTGQTQFYTSPLLWVCALIVLMILVPIALVAHTIIGIFLLPVSVFFMALISWLLTPLIAVQNQQKWTLPTVAVALGISITIWLTTSAEFNTEFPRSVDLLFVQDGNSNETFWASRYSFADPWTAPLLGETPKPVDVQIKPYGRVINLYGQASTNSLNNAPQIKADWTSSDESSNKISSVSIQLAPRQPGDRLTLAFMNLPDKVQTRIDNTNLDTRPTDGKLYADYRAVPSQGIEFKFTFPNGFDANEITMHIVSMTQGLDAQIATDLPARPSTAMPIANQFGSWATFWSGIITLPVVINANDSNPNHLD